jgi:hypothetical protein
LASQHSRVRPGGRDDTFDFELRREPIGRRATQDFEIKREFDAAGCCLSRLREKAARFEHPANCAGPSCVPTARSGGAGGLEIKRFRRVLEQGGRRAAQAENGLLRAGSPPIQ